MSLTKAEYEPHSTQRLTNRFCRICSRPFEYKGHRLLCDECKARETARKKILYNKMRKISKDREEFELPSFLNEMFEISFPILFFNFLTIRGLQNLFVVV